MIGKDNSPVLDAIDVDQLEIGTHTFGKSTTDTYEAYGGTNTFKYNFDEHWEKEVKACATI
jgi:hypothetical protein